ncbi:MAG TPA: hypothetical protein VEK80_01535, partial [Kribbellaceae bacterium]|nr:hypothetical protein [Kribbellaceae bacterium]
YHTFDSGGAVLRALRGVAARQHTGAGIRELAADLAAVVNEDMRGRRPLHLLAIEARSGDHVRSAVLRTTSSYRLTAMLAVLAVREIIAGRVPAGVSRADVLRTDLVTELAGLDRDTVLETQDTTLDSWKSDPVIE